MSLMTTVLSVLGSFLYFVWYCIKIDKEIEELIDEGTLAEGGFKSKEEYMLSILNYDLGRRRGFFTLKFYCDTYKCVSRIRASMKSPITQTRLNLEGYEIYAGQNSVYIKLIFKEDYTDQEKQDF